ncbi:MoxR family ATPase [Fulvivirga sp. M361]|uniref:AAA family ATPase n=1 Tax=Fulvivirga sp. M361 TaxID=2594266 RepID=UPI00117B1BC5|nr:MoxR family ATPase [Fulvivirga sp. M361]TRX59485.1 MoxR family ATPase [Fulvivirga sp. M361]
MTNEELKNTEQEVSQVVSKLGLLKSEMQKVIIGQDETIEQLIITFLAGGHALLEGPPGLAKTLMVRTLSQAVDLDFRRIQFTPDLMPSDIIGTEILEEDHTTGKKFFKFNKGPVFSNIILADEINRTPPKTQAALLEAMQEFEVSYSGKTYQLKRPFFILATQNPIEQAGTFPLPEAQLDRFLLYIQIGYPGENAETNILRSTTGAGSVSIEKVLDGPDIIELQELVREVVIADDLIAYVSRLVRGTRPQTTTSEYVKSWVSWGAGPRAGQALILTAKARALLKGRYAVIPEDIHVMSKPVLRHRILINFKAEAEGVSSDDITSELLKVYTLPSNGLK